MAKSIVGPVINTRGMVYAPAEKYGVMFLFARLLDEMGFVIEEIVPNMPRVVARRQIKEGLEKTELAFAFNSSEARGEGYLNGSDILICWQDDWGDCPCEVIELRSRLMKTVSPARRASDKIFGKAHTSDVAGASKSETQESVPVGDEESDEELQKKFNQTIKEIDDKIKNLF